MIRFLNSLAKATLFGPAYAAVENLISNPTPHDPKQLWDLVNSNKGSWLTENYPPCWVRSLLVSSKMKKAHRVGISKHYDLSNEFYELVLDKEYQFYSCADFSDSQCTLEQAQTNKAEYIANLIDPKPNEKILDLGCGWGAMLKHLSKRLESVDNLYGYTLSEEQLKHNDEHNGFHVELKNFITCDYKPSYFDKIFSIGSWEHVRREDLGQVTPKLFDTLKPGGRMIKHFICPLESRLSTDVLVAQLFFPGSWIPGYAEQIQNFEECGFQIFHRSIHDYRPTLRAWFDNLVANKERAIEVVGLKNYNKYLVFFAASHNYFVRGKAVLLRVGLQKPA